MSDPSIDESEIYHSPKFAVDNERRLELADIDQTKLEWAEEEDQIRRNYHNFTQKKYYKNNISLLREILDRTFTRHCIYAPTGCMKSSTLTLMEKYLSFYTDSQEQNDLKKIFLESTSEKIYKDHAHQYVVFRCSFQNLKLEGDCSLKNITEYIFDVFFDFIVTLNLELSPQDEDLFTNVKYKSNILFEIAAWLREKTAKKVAVLLDEIDFPLTWLVSVCNDTKRVKEIWNLYSEVLDRLSICTGIAPIAVSFGIHVVRGIVDTKKWIVETTLHQSLAEYFMFTREEVEAIVREYKREDNDLIPEKSTEVLLQEIENCYGNYVFNMYCPASVVRYLESKGAKKLYKKLRRTFDITNIEQIQIRSFLSAFIAGDKQILKITTSGDMRAFRQKDVALANYIRAGLLEAETNEGLFPDGKYAISSGNWENLNIIGFFLEKFLNISESNAAEKARILIETLEVFDITTLEIILNEFFNGLNQIELSCERDFYNPIHAYFYVLLSDWSISSEYSKRTVNKFSGLSGRIDLRLKNKSKNTLIIMELKYTTNDSLKAILAEKDTAFNQVDEKGYLSDADFKEFDDIVVIAVICFNNIVKLFSKFEKTSIPPKKLAITASDKNQPSASGEPATATSNSKRRKSNVEKKPPALAGT